MIQWYLSVINAIRAIETKANDALVVYEQSGKSACTAINDYMVTDYSQLWDLWQERFPEETLGSLGRHISFGMDCDYTDIIEFDLPELRIRAESHLANSIGEEEPLTNLGIERILHPIIMENAFQLFRNGHFREAVGNSIIAVFDYIRERTGDPDDGDRLIGNVMAPNNPQLILSDINTESGKNIQKGFMQIYKGAYQGIRNPSAHTLEND